MASGNDSEGTLHPDDLVGARLRTSLRGFDQLEVRALLNRAADRIRRLEGTIERLHDELENVDTRMVKVEDLDEDSLTAALGAETARVLRSAKEAATEILGGAEAKAAEMLREAEARSRQLMVEAEGVYASEKARADEAAAEILEKAKAAGRKELEKGRSEGRRLVAEARALRTRMLEDLAARRRVALSQLDGLRAAREQLLETYAVVEGTLHQATSELARADEVAQAAAEAARDHGPVGEPDEELAALEQMASAEPLDEAAVVGDEPGHADPDHDQHDGEDAPELGDPDEGDDDGDAEPIPRPSLRIDDLAADPVAEAVDEGATPTFAARSSSGEDGGDDHDDGDLDDDDQPDRRTSALRVLRSRKPKPKPAPEPRPVERAERAVTSEPVAPEGFTVVEEASDVEGVRIVRPAAEVDDLDQPAEAPVEASEELEAEADPEPDADAEPEDEGGEPDPHLAAIAEAEAELHAKPRPGSGVDALFDRIRHQRAEATGWARGVLAEDGDEDDDDDDDADEEPAPADAATDDDDDEGDDDESAADDARPVAFAARDDAMADVAPTVVRTLKRSLGDEQNEVLAAVRNARGSPQLDDVLPSLHEHRDAYAAALTEALSAVAQAGAESVGGSGTPPVTGLASGIATALLEPLRSRLAGVLDEAKGSDVGDLELADQVSAIYRQWRRQRLDRVADEALRSAFALGVRSAASDRDLVWTLDPAAGTCSPDCEDNALGGPVEAGQPFPAGGTQPPAHPDCRCLALPV